MRYMGSKARIAKYILPIILKDRQPGQWYIEGMCGGCNLIDKVDGDRMANDINEYLISMFVQLVNGWIPPEEITKEHYNKVRECYKNKTDEFLKSYVGYIGFTGSFNGRFFEGGYSGKVTIKDGTQRNYIAEGRKNLLKQIPLLKDVIFKCCDYRSLEIPDNSIVYYDPPYMGVQKYSYTINYTEFWEHCRKQVIQGHRVFISEYAAPEDFVYVWSGNIKTPLNQTITKNANEKLFVHKSQL